ncbi:hypothetical protein PRZ48_002653 [Zasmidium cellare]|uniref:AB hydrolase-1 domain-containing protein n=1 Tax=Zasmidium cellare TaxID=395010 RepID=A0ABR0ESW1_ZASCE|nr:hypothetical protein PRZ48_002653 [Zasmidium cellare]
MATDQFIEGKAPFDIPSIDHTCETYYKVFGDVREGAPPIIVVHGGPGSGHNYLLAFRKLWDRYKLPVIFYDQIGSARSTHLPYKKYDKGFWTIELLVEQLESLIKNLHLDNEQSTGYYLLGHSVGGMISSCFASRQPKGLKKLVLANAPGSVDLHMYGMDLWRKEMPDETQQVFDEAIRTRDWKAQSYLDALTAFNKKYWCRADPHPDELQQTANNHADDSTVTETMWGRSPFELVGSLKGWNCFSELHKINVPTLLYNGQWDIERDEVLVPYVEHVQGIRKVTIEGASHMSHLEETQDKVLELVGSFFTEE